MMYQFLNFLQTTKGPFWINAYPYFAYKDDPDSIPLDYVLFNPNQGMVDPTTNLHYDDMLYATADAVSFSIAKMGFKGIEVRVSETGWPSRGDPNEVGASLQNAAIYNRNLLKRQMANQGTPINPRTRLEVYLFALFNEDLKPGPTSERNYGLFRPDESSAFIIMYNNCNEVYTDDDTTLLQHLVPAVINIYIALAHLGYSNIWVSTLSSLAVLETSYPSSAGSFKGKISSMMYQFLNFLQTTKGPFWINAYPYFAYKDDPDSIPLDYVLFNPKQGMVDPTTNLHYDDMLYATADVVSFSIAKMGFKGIEVRVSETGWPSRGDPNEVGASLQNAEFVETTNGESRDTLKS
ncbi:hypothetical protein TSUD_400510 [Trifolium subterraneum]|uniref:glucan endo-1,3-beta-D-glucosidase n=1 Tax=Trifolium subterraneum TaxID=3900 RepID=A0A2Z6NK59_TRISU|nr:hypothetical protein TSUD_400510 [Trifolium subterraneum]